MNGLLRIFEKPIVVHALILVLILGYWSIRMLALPALGGDEAEQVLFAQSLQWGYHVANPPLYTWVLYALFALFGKSVGLVLGVKLSVLALIYLSLYQAARISLSPNRQADWGLVALSPILFFPIAWYGVFSYSHSLLSGLFVVLTYIAAFKMIRDGRLRWYLVFGLALGFGMLSKYSYGLFAVSLIVAMFSLASIRARLCLLSFGVAIVLAVGVMAPHGVWLAHSFDLLQQVAADKLLGYEGYDYFSRLVTGLGKLPGAFFEFTSPWWLVVVLAFPSLFRRHGKESNDDDMERLLGRALLGVILLMVAMVFAGVANIRGNYMFFLVLVPLYVFLRLPERVGRRRVYAAAVLAALSLSLGGLAVRAAFEPDRCRKCQLLVPYESIATALQAAGFSGGSVLASWYPQPLPGNLAIYMENARVASLKFSEVMPPRSPTPGQCLIMWVATESGGPEKGDIINVGNNAFGTQIKNDSPTKRLNFTFDRVSEKTLAIDYVLVEPGVDGCR